MESVIPALFGSWGGICPENWPFRPKLPPPPPWPWWWLIQIILGAASGIVATRLAAPWLVEAGFLGSAFTSVAAGTVVSGIAGRLVNGFKPQA